MANSSNELVPIRTVSQMTGVNPVTLRAWERRYGLIKPQRTPKGHRLYSRDDIELIHRVLGLLDRGMSIGQVRHALENASEEPVSEDQTNNWERYRKQMLAAIHRFDESALDETYNETLALYPVNVVTRRLVVPLLQEIGRRWESGEGTVAEEHFFGAYLRNKLGARFHHRPKHARGQRLIMACLPDQYHEIGLLLFALAASSRNFDIVLLGANLPLEELPQACEQAQADGVVLSGSSLPMEPELRASLARQVKRMTVPVFVGGKGPAQDSEAIRTMGATPLGEDIDLGLKQLSETLERAPGAGLPRRLNRGGRA
ncbi:DNA-binding transcriptional MerR regulator/methylmalonyl-CoA mutase cobalamin-binding subunit [Natronospira proteinivora]|uniref:DNA-binding transcriptional MerR regulator/methylmalonyl-CoA mutase cobalamin-binding subunit n=1 Tax=Natronospira proteinivora TaxID=1807133 RepID=A0ABT1G9L2_9GAMM|nr:MerR family transcriptional regulator [Natronospira proteinivora]MCP1727995.1 DNA-binding transcriptional MerR regulator/methylmalonyl-CoA mutase cobalamin-binding subunit [Natronospira proteinivora]